MMMMMMDGWIIGEVIQRDIDKEHTTWQPRLDVLRPETPDGLESN